MNARRTATIYDYANEADRLERVELKIREELTEGHLQLIRGRAHGGPLAVERPADVAKVLERMTQSGEIAATVVELPDYGVRPRDADEAVQ